MAPDSLLRESCDPPPASSKSRRSRFRRCQRDAFGVGVRGRKETLEGARTNVDFIIAPQENLSTGAPCERGGLIADRLLGDAVCEAFEFRGEFVLFDFIVHRFFANAEFARGETTATVASDESFKESESFDLRQRQTGETERRRSRKVGASGRSKRSGKRPRRLGGRRERNVGDGNARIVGACVARKEINGRRRRDGNGPVGAAGREMRVRVGRRGGENVATKRRFGRRRIPAGKTIEGIHDFEERRESAGGAFLTKASRVKLQMKLKFLNKESVKFVYFIHLSWKKRLILLKKQIGRKARLK